MQLFLSHQVKLYLNFQLRETKLICWILQVVYLSLSSQQTGKQVVQAKEKRQERDQQPEHERGQGQSCRREETLITCMAMALQSNSSVSSD